MVGVCVPSLACQQVKEEDDNPRVPSSKDRRQESVAGPKSEELVPPPELTMPVTAGVGPQAAGHTSRQVSQPRMRSING